MLNKDFLSGHYQKVAASFIEQSKIPEMRELASLVGALSFLGKNLEAKTLYKEQRENLESEERAACRFFLGLSYTRKSQYKSASKIFRVNLKSLRKKSGSLERFYVYQGIAFYLFFLGKLELSRKWALKSFDSAIEAKDLYARSLSTDLLAHIKLRLGEINVGLELLKDAEKLSVQLGNKSVSEAIKISDLQYQAQYGYNRENILNVLKTKFDSLVSEDNYTKAAIGLELARQLTLRGEYDQTEILLEKISTNIFATENRRQEIQLNLRFAENYYRMGKSSLAWNYLRSARRCLNFEADKSFEIQILGFEYKLFDESMRQDLTQNLQEKSKLFNTIINRNILSRYNVETSELFNNEDLYHNFLLSLEDTDDKVSKIIESGYLSLLAETVGVKRGEELFYFDQELNRAILFYDNRIEVSPYKLTPTDTKLLMAILAKKHTKEEICKRVWGYDYDPLRHDNIIYTGIRSLRKNLGTGGAWIETSENGYYFREDRKFKINDHRSVLEVKPARDNEDLPSKYELESFSSQLNLRQFKSLQYLKKHESLDVLTYQKIFKVSDVTASRDLRSLKELGFVVSVGKARATKYILVKK